MAFSATKKRCRVCSLTSSCARGWCRIFGETQNSPDPPLGDRYHMASLCAPLLGCCSNEEGIVMCSPQRKCCTTALKISHISRLGRNPPPSSNERAALPTTGSYTVPPEPSGFELSIGATPIYHSSQSRAGASQRSSPPVDDSPGKLTDSFTARMSQKQRKSFHSHLLLPQREETDLEQHSVLGQAAEGWRTVLSRPIFV